MKKLFYVLPLIVLAYACGEQGGAANTKGIAISNLGDSISYSMGMSMVKDIDKYFENLEGVSFSEDPFKAGVMEGLAKEGRLDDAQNESLMKTFQNLSRAAQAKKQQAEGEKERFEGAKFLAENGAKEGVKTTASGLQYLVKEAGSGASPTATDKVKVHYEGKLINGKVFDSSLARGEPISFKLNEVIPGWTEGIQLMKPGAKYTFFIPGDLAYGQRGYPPDIPANATLIFDVELIGIE